MAKLTSYVQLIRPTHWAKNIFVFAALVFAQDNLLYDLSKVTCALYAFVCFCLVSSFAYVVNDLRDRQQDREHPRKRHRPLASGAISPGSAWVIAIVLFVLGLGGGFRFSPPLGLVLVFYLVLTLTYSWWLKNKVIVDVMCIAIGFVLRAMAGVVALQVPLSPWLIVCTFTLCLFVGFGKRRCELAVAHNDHRLASDHRPVLERYTLELLSLLLTISAAVAVVTFLLYTMDPQTAAKFGTNYMIYSVPLVIYGIFRFAALIETGRYDSPMDILGIDRPFQITIGLWLLMVIIIVHWGTRIQGWIQRLEEIPPKIW